MAKPEPKKRKLKYANFDEMMADVRSLCDNGYISNGNWNLGQATNHVAEWMRFPMDGFPKPPLPIAMIMWVMKHTVGPGMKRKIFAEGFKGGMMTAPETVIEPDKISDTDGVEKLQQIADRLMAFEGAMASSPLFGKMDQDTAVKISLLHAEHHFGYLEPR